MYSTGAVEECPSSRRRGRAARAAAEGRVAAHLRCRHGPAAGCTLPPSTGKSWLSVRRLQLQMSSTAAFATFDVEPKASGGGNGGLLAAAKFKSKEKLEAANEDAVAAMERQEKHVLFYRGKNLTQTIFMLLDEPESSYAARLISVGILLLIVISSVTFVSETHPHVRNDEDTLALIQTLETVCIGVFTTEYLLRVATCRERPRKNQSILKYMRNPMNVIDVLSILPFYVELILTYIKSDTDVSKLAVVRMLRMSRLFRVLKFGGYADDLQLFVEGFRRSSEGLAVLGFLLALYLCVGGSILYMLEEPAQRAAARGGFESIPSAWYFVVASMTTVGYGDQYPITPEGKMFCSVVMLCGIFVLGLPIVIIGHSFEEGGSHTQPFWSQ
eukprot:COSAG01_NODE_323_length_18848_cov_144.375273_11_plen_386_part_00